MKEFVKNYILLFDTMGTSTDEKVEAAIDVYEALKNKDNKSILDYIIKPLLTEYRETEDKTAMLDIEELFLQLIDII